MAALKLPKIAVIDFETLKIKARPVYPPVPVGVSILMPGKKPHYLAWGHLDGNNCSWAEAYKALKAIWDDKSLQITGQNLKFDLDVAEVHFGLALPDWRRIEDTMFLIFLDDPHQIELGLKPSAERLLGEPPEEQDEVIEWLVKNQPLKAQGIRMNRGKAGEHYAGAYVAYAPGTLTGKYADGDTRRTRDIFNLLWPKTRDREMLGAYDTERELLPILLRMERRGIWCDFEKLKADMAKYRRIQAQVDQWIVKKLKAPADINLDSGEEVMAAMLACGIADRDKALVTAGGKISTSKDSLNAAIADRAFLGIWRYRAGLKTCLNTFMQPWLEECERTGGTISTSWNQVKSPAGNSAVGTRTGRLSASRFMNMPKEFNAIFRHENPGDKKLPVCPIKDLPSLPWVRSYIAPFPGHVLVDRDYSQQEPRILAHFDGGALQDKYNENPWIDFHDYAKAELEIMGLFYDRRPVKNTNLGLIYGMGVGTLAERNDQTYDEAKILKAAILKLYPGLADMYKEMKQRYQAGQPLRTWGGREYYCEPPRLFQGRIVHYDYKMVNILIQGSAADCTKRAVINWDRAVHAAGKQDEWFLILNVHDQLTASVPIKELTPGMMMMKDSMESVSFDVPMLSEGAISFTNWAELKDWDKKGKQVYHGKH